MPGRLAHCSRYALYYGPGGDYLLDRYDLAILEPAGWSPGQLRPLRSRRPAHPLLLAYLSLLEIPAGSGPPPPHVLRHQDQPVQNPDWQTWILDPRHPRTLQRLLDLATELRAGGWDGLFLDTAAGAETPSLPAGLRGVLVPSTARMVAELASFWPEAILVQNWGFGPLLPLTAPFLDGVCWEDFPWARLARDPAARVQAQRLRTWAEAGNLRVLALNQDRSVCAQAAAVAKDWGFLWYGAPGSYTSPPAPVLS